MVAGFSPKRSKCDVAPSHTCSRHKLSKVAQPPKPTRVSVEARGIHISIFMKLEDGSRNDVPICVSFRLPEPREPRSPMTACTCSPSVALKGQPGS